MKKNAILYIAAGLMAVLFTFGLVYIKDAGKYKGSSVEGNLNGSKENERVDFEKEKQEIIKKSRPRLYKRKEEKDALTVEERERKSNLSRIYAEKWERYREKIVDTCRIIGIREEQIKRIVELVKERDSEVLDIMARKPKNNTEYLKAKRRAYNWYENEIVHEIDRKTMKKLKEQAPEVFICN